jgi:hypothetical protein
VEVVVAEEAPGPRRGFGEGLFGDGGEGGRALVQALRSGSWMGLAVGGSFDLARRISGCHNTTLCERSD